MANMALAFKSSLRKIANKVCGHEVFAPMSLADGLKAIKKKFGAVGKPSGIPGFRGYMCKDGTILKIEYVHPSDKPLWAACLESFNHLGKGKTQNFTALNITQHSPKSDSIISSMHKRVLAKTTSPQQVEGVKSIVIKPQGEFTQPSAYTTRTKHFSHNLYGNIFS